jgi:hypothetical protein
VVLVDAVFEDAVVGVRCVVLVEDLVVAEMVLLLLLLLHGVLGTETVPRTQYCWTTTSVGQLTSGFRASKAATVSPKVLARVSHVSPLLATTDRRR